jgi:sterol 3beta-glucosyltransferase
MALRIAVATMGSMGDVQPYLALTRALRARGHDAFVVSGGMWAERVRAVGLPFRDSGNPATAEFHERMLREVLAEGNQARQLSIIYDTLADDFCTAMPVTRRAIADADLVVSHVVDMGSLAAAEAEGKPLVTVHVFPGFLRTRDSNPTGVRLGRWGDALVWALLGRVVRKRTDHTLNRIFGAAGIEARRDVLLGANDRAARILLAISPSLLARDSLWDERVCLTGYWFLDESERPPEPALERFVQEGEPKVVVTLGSMTGFNAATVMRAIVEGLNGRRAVVQAGAAGLGASEPVPDNIHVAGFVPHAWLFSRAACVVHHGGAGTTAAAMRAGVPQIIVWHLGDQVAWGRLVAQKGLGPKPLAHGKLTGRWLRATLDRVLADGPMRARARAQAEVLAGERGLDAAVIAIESVAGARGQAQATARR